MYIIYLCISSLRVVKSYSVYKLAIPTWIFVNHSDYYVNPVLPKYTIISSHYLVAKNIILDVDQERFDPSNYLASSGFGLVKKKRYELMWTQTNDC